MDFSGIQLSQKTTLEDLGMDCYEVCALQQLDEDMMDAKTSFPLFFAEVDSLPDPFEDPFFNFRGEIEDLANENIQVKKLESFQETPEQAADSELPENAVVQEPGDMEEEEEEEEDDDEQVTVPVTPVEEIWVGELCAVCGDTSCGQHFGAPSCDGCKAFFRRIVIDTQDEPIRSGCKGNGKCFVDKSTRGECRYCRFQKCFDVGMERDLVHGAIVRGTTKAQPRPRRREEKGTKENKCGGPEISKTSKMEHSDVSDELDKFPLGKHFERMVALDRNGMLGRVYVKSSAWIVPRSFNLSNILDSIVNPNMEKKVQYWGGHDVLNFQEKMQFYNLLDMYASMPIVHSLTLPIRLRRFKIMWPYLFVLMSVERRERPKIILDTSLQRRNDKEGVQNTGTQQLSLEDKKPAGHTAEICNVVFDTLESMKLGKFEVLVLKLLVLFGDLHNQEIPTFELQEVREFLLKLLRHIMSPKTMEICLDTIDLMKEAGRRHLCQLLFPGVWNETDWLMDWFFYNLQ